MPYIDPRQAGQQGNPWAQFIQQIMAGQAAMGPIYPAAPSIEQSVQTPAADVLRRGVGRGGPITAAPAPVVQPRDPTAEAAAALRGRMPSRELETLRAREQARQTPPDPQGVSGTGYDTETPSGPESSRSFTGQMRQLDADRTAKPPSKEDGRYDVIKGPGGVPQIIWRRNGASSSPGSFTPDQYEAQTHPAGNRLPSMGNDAVASGSQSPPVNGAASAPDESMPNRRRTGRRVSLTPGAQGQPGAPMPPPAAPPVQSPADQLLSAAGAPMPPPPAPPVEGGVGSFLKSDKGQDLADWLLTMGLGTMAAGARPGANALSALGEGGLAANQQLQTTADRRENRQLRRDTAQQTADLRREQIAASQQTAADRIQAQREAAKDRNETARTVASMAHESRVLAASIAAAARSGSGGDEKQARIQARIDKDASDYLDRAAKPPTNAPLNWKPPATDQVRKEVVRRFPKSTVARSYQAEDLDADLNRAIAQIQVLPLDKRAAAEAELRAKYNADRARITAD